MEDRRDIYLEYRLPHLEPEKPLPRNELFIMATPAECVMALVTRHRSPVTIVGLHPCALRGDEEADIVYRPDAVDEFRSRVPETVLEDFEAWINQIRIEEKHK